MAVNDPLWEYGGPVLIDSNGGTVDPHWEYGGPYLVHEYVAAGGVTELKRLSSADLLMPYRGWVYPNVSGIDQYERQTASFSYSNILAGSGVSYILLSSILSSATSISQFSLDILRQISSNNILNTNIQNLDLGVLRELLSAIGISTNISDSELEILRKLIASIFSNVNISNLALSITELFFGESILTFKVEKTNRDFKAKKTNRNFKIKQTPRTFKVS